jgi:hypothetical protein
MDVKVERRKQRVRCVRSLVEHVATSLEKMEHGSNSVWEVVAQTNAACETMVLFNVREVTRSQGARC